MKKDIHPKYKEAIVTCSSCGTTFKTHSTISKIQVDVCSNCHPFYTGTMFGTSKAGRIDRFNKRAEKSKTK